jgi:hypothetical protein
MVLMTTMNNITFTYLNIVKKYQPRRRRRRRRRRRNVFENIFPQPQRLNFHWRTRLSAQDLKPESRVHYVPVLQFCEHIITHTGIHCTVYIHIYTHKMSHIGKKKFATEAFKFSMYVALPMVCVAVFEMPSIQDWIITKVRDDR